ncbi:hypothetical protein EYF80_062545 [Liparis tanakae]|uniref:Uncharacterized protein n=1 Tax=Liparis tanakae TaxID=230148 RepID=A0A4Z2EF35_9TELE|nr:hypothetical protein EYF80_062545 [Liparis tanakae]
MCRNFRGTYAPFLPRVQALVRRSPGGREREREREREGEGLAAGCGVAAAAACWANGIVKTGRWEMNAA